MVKKINKQIIGTCICTVECKFVIKLPINATKEQANEAAIFVMKNMTEQIHLNIKDPLSSFDFNNEK